MANSNVPVRVPERPEAKTEVSVQRPAILVPERKPIRFVIKMCGPVPC